MAVRNYIAIAEPSDDGTWWFSFLGFPGVTSAGDSAGQIVAQAQDALASAIAAGAPCRPRSKTACFRHTISGTTTNRWLCWCRSPCPPLPWRSNCGHHRRA